MVEKDISHVITSKRLETGNLEQFESNTNPLYSTNKHNHILILFYYIISNP